MRLPDLSLEHDLARKLGVARICGVDEAGRGPWAGPVAAGAAILDPATAPDGLNDSKKLSPPRRAALEGEIKTRALSWSVAFAEVAEIDALGLGPACDLAMRRAVAGLDPAPQAALVDGRRAPALPCPAEAVVRGDGRAASIAAASILAKTARDRVMIALDADWPGYGWDRNMGYGAPAHAAGLNRLGVTPHHRRSFAPIHKILCGERLKTRL